MSLATAIAGAAAAVATAEIGPNSAAAAAKGAATASTIGSTFVSLFVVIVLIFALAWVARRLGGVGPARSAGPLKVLASLSLGMKERVLLIEAGDAQLLLGQTPAGITLLQKLDSKIEMPLPADKPNAPDFSAVLKRSLGLKS